MKTLGITGLRPHKMPWGQGENNESCTALRKDLGKAIEKFYNKGYSRFATGMALGPDTWFAEEVMFLPQPRELCCYIPYRGHENGWNPEDQDEYRDLLKEADKIIVAGKGYTKNIMTKRDRMLVDDCDALIAVWDGKTTGGTQHTVEYARKVGVPVKIIDPMYYWEKYKS